MPLDTSYPAILKNFGDFKRKGWNESQALLAWFLRCFYRLDSTEVDDAICDQHGDKGIDGIYVNHLTQEIDVFQSRIATVHSGKSLGDTALKELHGTLGFFKDEASVVHLISVTPSVKLKQLLERENVTQFVREKYNIRGIFVTTRTRDANSTEFLAVTPSILLFDDVELKKRYLPIGKADPISTSAAFSISPSAVFQYDIKSGPEMFVAAISASELIKMEGIANQELFAWNLRYRLRRSAVNKKIDESIEDKSVHRYFPAFHNGMTILAEDITINKEKTLITISGYSVVNGCQSLNALFTHSTDLTPELALLTKIIKVSPRTELAAQITDHTNRQNGVTARDLQSNNDVQMRLQNEIETKFGKHIKYRIARGEEASWDDSYDVIENEDAARLLLAFDLKSPESCHQSYKLFEPDLHAALFGRPGVNAERIIALWDIYRVISSELDKMDDREFAGYSLAPYLFLYLLRETLELPESKARDLLREPMSYINSPHGRSHLRKAIEPIVACLGNSLAASITHRKETGNPFDPKKHLKSKSEVAAVRAFVIPLYQSARKLGYVKSFSEEWDSASS